MDNDTDIQLTPAQERTLRIHETDVKGFAKAARSVTQDADSIEALILKYCTTSARLLFLEQLEGSHPYRRATLMDGQ